MSDEEIKRKIKKVVDNPADVIEKGVKKGWRTVKAFGKGVEKGVSNEKQEEEKK